MQGAENFPAIEKPVVIVRHEFEPSGHLQNSLRRLLGQDYQPIKSFYSTRHAVLDGQAYDKGEYDETLETIDQYFDNLEQPQVYPLDIKLRLSETALSIALRPYDQQRFDRIVEPLGALPNLRPHSTQMHHYVVAHIQRTSLTPLEIPTDEFNQALHTERQAGRHEQYLRRQEVSRTHTVMQFAKPPEQSRRSLDEAS